MADKIVKIIDIKGEPGTLHVPDCGAVTYALYNTNFQPLTYAGIQGIYELTPLTPFTPSAAQSGGGFENDKDGKLTITCRIKATGKQRRFTIPAPKINVENGICVVGSEKRRSVPAVAPDGATGMGGNDVVLKLELAYGLAANSLTFLSGHLKILG